MILKVPRAVGVIVSSIISTLKVQKKINMKKKIEMEKIKDSENIDKLRSEIGLIELKYDALYLNYQLPVGYKFKGE